MAMGNYNSNRTPVQYCNAKNFFLMLQLLSQRVTQPLYILVVGLCISTARQLKLTLFLVLSITLKLVDIQLMKIRQSLLTPTEVVYRIDILPLVKCRNFSYTTAKISYLNGSWLRSTAIHLTGMNQLVNLSPPLIPLFSQMMQN